MKTYYIYLFTISRHPLFPLMALLFEKCEALSQIADTQMDNFDSDIQTFLHHLEKEKQPLLSDDEELNELVTMVSSIVETHNLQ